MLDAKSRACEDGHRVIAQGGVVYDAPLKRYLFASWSCATHEYYEAPNPWGPWHHFLSTDFGVLKTAKNYGQYGTSIPSKFISPDGSTMYLQSNVWGRAYAFALRKVFLDPYLPGTPSNDSSEANLAVTPGTRAISKSTHYGLLCGKDCSDKLATGMGSGSEDNFDKDTKTIDWWGYTWPQPLQIQSRRLHYGRHCERGWLVCGEARCSGTPAFSVERCERSDDRSGLSIFPAGRLSRLIHVRSSRQHLG